MKIIDKKDWFKEQLKKYENDVDYLKEYIDILTDELKIADDIIAKYESSPVEPEVKPASAGLLPCPFCGGKGYRGYDPEDEDYSVYCTNCGAIVFGTTKEEIETKWNRRLSV